jgi:acyl-CoA thioester hydrolase
MPFLLDLAVQPADIDELGHASNLVYLRWVQEAALAHSEALGWPQPRYFERKEAWVVRRHELIYVRPAMPGDLLRIETRVATMSAANSVRKTRVLRANDGAELCRAETDWVYFDLARGRPKRIPEEVKASFPLEPDAGEKE